MQIIGVGIGVRHLFGLESNELNYLYYGGILVQENKTRQLIYNIINQHLTNIKQQGSQQTNNLVLSYSQVDMINTLTRYRHSIFGGGQIYLLHDCFKFLFHFLGYLRSVGRNLILQWSSMHAELHD